MVTMGNCATERALSALKMIASSAKECSKLVSIGALDVVTTFMTQVPI